MSERLIQLYPEYAADHSCKGLYLAHRVHELGSREQPFVYGNFVSSLDGRIALRDPARRSSHVPKALTSDTDFRLLLELHAQADCLITHGGYMRAIASGQLDDILQVGTAAGSEDLAAWRMANGLAPQPAICIASGSLDFPFPESVVRHGQRVLIATGNAARAARVRELESEGYEVIIAGAGTSVEGGPLATALAHHGFRSLFLLAGPRMLETMLRDGVLSRLYVTITHQLLGGESFHSLIDGPEMHAAGRLRLMALYLDTTLPKDTGQFFAQFEPLR